MTRAHLRGVRGAGQRSWCLVCPQRARAHQQGRGDPFRNACLIIALAHNFFRGLTTTTAGSIPGS